MNLLRRWKRGSRGLGIKKAKRSPEMSESLESSGGGWTLRTHPDRTGKVPGLPCAICIPALHFAKAAQL